MSIYADLIVDFAERTLANLDLIEQAVREGNSEAYDVTQLWNSLLGLIVAPRELDIEVFPETRMSELHALGWPLITTGGKLEPDTLRGLVTALRNAVAHFNVEFHGNGEGEIISVSLWNDATDEWNHPVPYAPRQWQSSLNIRDLEDLARKIAAMYIEQPGIWAASS